MPSFAVYNNQIITPVDIYKFGVDKSGPFYCFKCDKKVQFRQSRNADNNYTEHFYHPNTTKDTHIKCETLTLDKVKDTDTWHNMLSDFIQRENREVVRKIDDIKHIVDAYDDFNDMGIEFQNSKISVEDIESRDATTYLDWIFNVENQYIRKVEIGNLIVCEIPHDNWEKAVKAVKNNVYLYTGFNEWVILENRESYRVEIENKRRNVWIGKPITFNEIYEATCLQNMLTAEGYTHLNQNNNTIKTIKIIYARCKKSMYLLDDIHRDYMYSHIFSKLNEVVAVKSVAGSGKTTTLLELAKIHKDKRILYLAFNKALITEISSKLKKNNIKNITPSTFDALLYNTYISIKRTEPSISSLTPQTIQNIIPWFKGKPYSMRKYYVDMYTSYCGNITYNTPQEYTLKTLGKDHGLLNTLWSKTLSGQMITFESLRKLSFINKWFSTFIDKTYDIIMVDETQDFDMMMLKMLLNDTTIPKIFVGDPKQSIYQWRGCINGFEYMPKDALIIEFYSTFRVGDPACEKIRQMFDDCWMISKSKNKTEIHTDIDIIKDEKYTYLFRTWRQLLTTAQGMKQIFIQGYDSKIETIRKLHNILSSFGGSIDDEEFEDDLPKFLKSISKSDLECLISKIEENITTKDMAKYKMYIIHSYKGLEDDNIRIATDIDTTEEVDENLHYVALTRGMKYIISDDSEVNTIQTKITNVFVS